MTSAKRIGVSSGTRIWRGVRAVSASRRPASVASPDISRSPFGSGGFRQAIACQPQVDVVQGRRAGADRARTYAEVVEGGDNVARRAVVQRGRERGTARARIAPGPPP